MYFGLSLSHYLSASLSPPPPPPPSFPLTPLSLTLSLSPSPFSLSPYNLPNLNAREAVIVDVILFQDSASVVIEIDSYLFPAVNSVVSEYRVTACRDPNSG